MTKVDLVVRRNGFPALPKAWRESSEAMAWHSKVIRTIAKLKECDVEGFKQICKRLSVELQVRASYI